MPLWLIKINMLLNYDIEIKNTLDINVNKSNFCILSHFQQYNSYL